MKSLVTVMCCIELCSSEVLVCQRVPQSCLKITNILQPLISRLLLDCLQTFSCQVVKRQSHQILCHFAGKVLSTKIFEDPCFGCAYCKVFCTQLVAARAGSHYMTAVSSTRNWRYTGLWIVGDNLSFFSWSFIHLFFFSDVVILLFVRL